MSLTTHLDNPRSPVRQLLEWATPLLKEAGGNSADARVAKKLLGIDKLPALVTPNEAGANPGTVGAAFDYWVRYHLGIPARTDLVAFTGASIVAKALVPSAAPAIISFFTNLDDLGQRLDLSKPLPEQTQMLLARYCVVLALFESVYRAGQLLWELPVTGPTGASTPETEPMLRAAKDSDVAAVIALGGANLPTMTSWRERVDSGATYIPNPTFAGSPSVGGADADLVLGDEVIEVKTVKDLSAATVRKALMQLVGYTLLDWDDASGIRQVGVFFARQGYRETWPLWSLLRPLGDRKLAWVVEGGQPEAAGVVHMLEELRNLMQQVCSGGEVLLVD